MGIWLLCGKWSHLSAFVIHTMRQRKLDMRIMELLNSSTFAIRRFDWLNLDYLDSISLSTMTSTHITISLRNCTCHCYITILPVHVVMTSPGIITKPNPIIFNRAQLLLENLKLKLENKDKTTQHQKKYLFTRIFKVKEKPFRLFSKKLQII